MAKVSKTTVKKSPSKKVPLENTASVTIVRGKAPRDQPINIDELPWRAIHIFGYGETHLIAKDGSSKVENDKLKTIDVLIEHLGTLQQKGTKVSLKDMHVINLVNEVYVEFRPVSEKNNFQRFEWNTVDKKLVGKIYKEILDKI